MGVPFLVAHTYPVGAGEWFGYDRTMSEGPEIARVAALVADPARCAMLIALMDGRALTATELAGLGGITKQTASSHLAKLVDGEVLTVEAQGRHRYFRLAGPHVAGLLEALMVFSSDAAAPLRVGPRDPALEEANRPDLSDLQCALSANLPAGIPGRSSCSSRVILRDTHYISPSAKAAREETNMACSAAAVVDPISAFASQIHYLQKLTLLRSQKLGKRPSILLVCKGA
ncbi:MAG: transcriptional regulator, ArsR family [Devosia sp.]|jgi:DNA-binding transcriptional ArsR family regulator|nr:transcriptional regulator, ArsR family [Devosia sp.]